ncbi:hypothetical protein [Corynebacterium heidelbergense]|uniref:FHA domain-containing protein n=1 Tax=Corynebacterium heidelbergense TaxID=2055947 RepID=A0A364VAE8_9CORY|nr:hypothetical protein [Corynebacterium heidelbergense]RAV33615.1 hypothetical protein CWC39_07515 [Corynebacterium heidelbergense]WCZ35763.1 hypothetical protein CHEID_00920 [Corynebacterium heidelbergense]
MKSPDLVIIDDLVGGRWTLQPGESTTIGRAARIPVGADDRYMHRVLLEIWYANGTWMVANRGNRVPVQIESRQAGALAHMRLGPGASSPLPAHRSALVFQTPETTYELHVTLTRAVDVPLAQPVHTAPMTAGQFSPNAEQAALLRALAAPLVRRAGAGNDDIPTVRQLQDTLDWSQKKVNTKIDYLCRKLAENGFAEFSHSGPGPALSRRIQLARFAAEHRRYWDRM